MPISPPRFTNWPSAVSPGGESGTMAPNTTESCAWAGIMAKPGSAATTAANRRRPTYYGVPIGILMLETYFERFNGPFKQAADELIAEGCRASPPPAVSCRSIRTS